MKPHLAQCLVEDLGVTNLGDRHFEIFHRPGRSPGGLDLYNRSIGAFSRAMLSTMARSLTTPIIPALPILKHSSCWQICPSLSFMAGIFQALIKPASISWLKTT